jgi:hypothetical protein
MFSIDAVRGHDLEHENQATLPSCFGVSTARSAKVQKCGHPRLRESSEVNWLERLNPGKSDCDSPFAVSSDLEFSSQQQTTVGHVVKHALPRARHAKCLDLGPITEESQLH